MKFILIGFIRVYQKYLRRFHNRECIYTPSCSNYTIQAIQKYGAVKGAYYGYLRIKRCNGALYSGGNDPV
ncbi:membrane protein insertion efficiency factor YidD [Halomonas populi]|uniref:membrane protein insertion efficiency factor YidD n=1 Tax=Vreelandella populi TaxID=2498858 RepID=UPI000F8CECF7|nr:membrane protein insertion efficiency factor YidD [Halomonas populi]